MAILARIAIILAVLTALPAWGQADTTAATEPESEETAVTADDEPVIKVYTPAEVRRICRKHEGQLIAYYGEVYQVKDCQRRPVVRNRTVYNLQRSGRKILDVNGDVIAALPEGEPVDLAMSTESARGCKELAGKYVTFSSVDVYFVENCKKRLFPDWETYIKHRERRGDEKGEILSLSWVEFAALESGEPILSIMDDIYAKMLSGEAGVDVIPVDEACEGLESKLAGYYARLYRIERCRKREIVEPELYLKQAGRARFKIQEMTSEQWLSLPDGEPIEVKRPQR